MQKIEERHLTCIRELVPPSGQSALIGKVKTDLNVLETLAEGAFLIGETTPKLLDKMVSYGELLSSFIIASYYQHSGLDSRFKDSRELITTDEAFGGARVLRKETNSKIKDYFKTSAQITVLTTPLP